MPTAGLRTSDGMKPGDAPHRAAPGPGSTRPQAPGVLLGGMMFPAPSPVEVERFLAAADLDVAEIGLPVDPGRIPGAIRRRIARCAAAFPGRIQLHEVLPLALAHRDRAFRRRLLARLAEDVRLAEENGIAVLTLHTTCTRSVRPLRHSWRQGRTRWLARALDLDVTPYFQESLEVLRDALSELALTARSSPGARVRIAVENNFRDTRFFGRRLDRVSDILGLIEGLNLPTVRMCFDVFKAQSTERSVSASLKQAAAWVVNIHASDATPGDTAFFRQRAAVGEGTVDWPAVAAALAQADYAGAVVFEMMPDIEAVRRSSQRLRALLATAQGNP